MSAGAQESLGLVILRDLERSGPKPRLTWYGDDGRIELSGHVLANWITKSANLLADEIQLEAGERLLVDLPPHWKTCVLVSAGLVVGADVRVLDRRGSDGIDPEPCDGRLVVTTDPSRWSANLGVEDVLAVALDSLARRFEGVLPALAIDWTEAVRGHGDRLGPVPAADPEGPAVTLGGRQQWTYADLVAVTPASTSSRPARTLETDGSPEHLVHEVLVPLAEGRAVVLAPRGLTERARRDEGL